MESKKTITITFGDQAENNIRMQVIGKMADVGFDVRDLKLAKKKFEELGYECELINLCDYIDVDTEEARVLIVRNGADAILSDWGANSDDVFDEQIDLKWDTKAKMYGRVVDKHARHNLCYGNESQNPDYENGKGRIIDFEGVPCTNFIRKNLHKYFGTKAKNLVAEGNLYYDINSTGIGYHADNERKKVIAIRLGATMSLYYHWFLNGNPIGTRIKLSLNHGDLYAMSEFATGVNRKTIPILRHSAGCDKYTTIKPK